MIFNKNFYKGMFSITNIFGNHSKISNKIKSDEEALYNDWLIIGKHLNDVRN